MTLEVRKIKLKTSATTLKKIPFDVVYFVRGDNKKKIPEMFKACLIIQPDDQFRTDISNLPIKYEERHGLLRSAEKKRNFEGDSLPTYESIYGKLTPEWLVIIAIHTRSVGGEPRPSYFANRRVQAYLERKHEAMQRYKSHIGLGNTPTALNDIRLQVNGKDRSPCTMCNNGLLKSIKWNHCQLGTKTCLENIMMSKRDTFTAKHKVGETGIETSPEVALEQA